MSAALTHAQAPPWQTRRMRLIERALADVRRESESGKRGVVAVLASVAARYNGRRLGNGHNLKLSYSTLERCWYTSLKHGDSEALRLRFGQRAIGIVRIPAYARYLCCCVAVADGLNVPELFARLQQVDPALPFSIDTLRRAMPARELSGARNARIEADLVIRRLAEARSGAMAATSQGHALDKGAQTQGKGRKGHEHQEGKPRSRSERGSGGRPDAAAVPRVQENQDASGGNHQVGHQQRTIRVRAVLTRQGQAVNGRKRKGSA